MPWGLKPFQQSGQTNSVAVEQLPASPDRGRRFGGNRVGVDGGQARADGTDAASQESTTPLKPTEGLSGPPAAAASAMAIARYPRNPRHGGCDQSDYEFATQRG